MVTCAVLLIVGPGRLVAAVRDYRWRIRAIVAPIAVLVLILFLRGATKDLVPILSWRIVGIRVTQHIFDLERVIFGENPVAILQSFQTPELTSYFVFTYIYGYAFLLLFPFVAYFALDRMDELRALLLAYTTNYGVGLVLYVLLVAYGPRNFDPTLFDAVLYDAYPQARNLTNSVNQNVNVFPSLHTSLAMTTLCFAWHTREKYPLWLPVAAVLAISVVVSTMYLGIHWLSDAVAGTVLALCSTYVGVNYTVEEIAASVRTFVRSRLENGLSPRRE